MNKHQYTITINSKPKKGKEFIFKYGNTKNINLNVGNNCVFVSFCMSVLYDMDTIFDKDIVIDAIKKAYFCHILLYGKNLIRKSLCISIDDNEYDFIEKSNNRLFSLIEDDNKIDYYSEIKDIDKIINCVLNTPINKSVDSRISSIYAYIMSRRQKYTVERFIYTWMSFNAFYNSLYCLDNNVSINVDSKKLSNLINHYFKINNNISSNFKITNSIKDRIAYQVYSIVDEWNGEPVTYDFIDKKIAKIIKSVFKTNNCQILSAYSYLLTDFSYFFRCNIIHGSKPLKLLCFENERELKCIKFVNSLLTEFLKDHLSDIY